MGDDQMKYYLYMFHVCRFRLYIYHKTRRKMSKNIIFGFIRAWGFSSRFSLCHLLPFFLSSTSLWRQLLKPAAQTSTANFSKHGFNPYLSGEANVSHHTASPGIIYICIWGVVFIILLVELNFKLRWVAFDIVQEYIWRSLRKFNLLKRNINTHNDKTYHNWEPSSHQQHIRSFENTKETEISYRQDNHFPLRFVCSYVQSFAKVDIQAAAMRLPDIISNTELEFCLHSCHYLMLGLLILSSTYNRNGNSHLIHNTWQSENHDK